MTKAPTVYDVAAHAGVSIATVSRVLRRPDDVRPETRTRVLGSVRALGYVPSGAARGWPAGVTACSACSSRGTTRSTSPNPTGPRSPTRAASP
nr:hypothetical protein GCM10025699_73650 [Microbacterium flavescens]